MYWNGERLISLAVIEGLIETWDVLKFVPNQHSGQWT